MAHMNLTRYEYRLRSSAVSSPERARFQAKSLREGWDATSIDFKLLAFLLALALLLGAGGVPGPILEGLTIVGSLVLAGVAIHSANALSVKPALPLVLLVVSVSMLALLQLIPLPFSWWSTLPFRSTGAWVMNRFGDEPAWPLSISPQSTLWSFLSLGPPLLAFFLAFALSRGERIASLRVIVGLALLSGVLAGMQALFGERFYIHVRSITAGPSGLFANQNTQADFMIVAIAASLVLLSERRGEAGRIAALLALILFFVVCTVLTGSRMGTALLTLPLIMGMALFWKRRASVRQSLSIVRGAALALLAGGYAVLSSRVGQTVSDRFMNMADGRITDIWPDASHLAWEAFPYGTGLGTFIHSFEMAERLEVVDTTRANRAHSDWLEFIIEGGAPAMLILACLLAMLCLSIWRKLRSGLEPVDNFSFVVIALVAIHSLVDYPLRAIAMAVIAAIALAWAFSDGTQSAIDG